MDQAINLKHFNYAFDLALNGFAVPHQLRRFMWKVFILSEPGRETIISDSVFAEQLGNVSRNYVSKLRRKLLKFQAEFTEFGQNYTFISITDSSFDYRTKKPVPTKYNFSLEFVEHLKRCIDRSRSRREYANDPFAAIRAEICGAPGRALFSELGYYNQRKLKKQRTPDQVFGTYLVKFDRQLDRLFESTKKLGFDSNDLLHFLAAFFPQVLGERYAQQIFTTGPNFDKSKSFESFARSALDYYSQKQAVAETVIPKKHETKTRKDNPESRGLLGRLDLDAGRAEANEKLICEFIESQRYLRNGPKFEFNANLVSSAGLLRFFKRIEAAAGSSARIE